MIWLIVALASSNIGERSGTFFSPDGQERCEAICTGCIEEGGSPEECFENVLFKICCHGNGGRTMGCGCREAL